MWCHWLLMTAVLGQTTQPAEQVQPADQATPPAITVAAADDGRDTRPRITVSGSAREQRATTTQPATNDRTADEKETARRKLDTAATVTELRQLSGEPIDIEVTADGQLMIIAPPEDLKILEGVIEAIDEPGPEMTFDIFVLKHAQARDTAETIEKFWNDLKKPLRGDLLPEDRISITAEPRANMLIIGGTSDALEAVGRIIKKIDVPLPTESFQVQTVFLEHRKASEAAEILRDMLEARQKKLGLDQALFDIYADPPTNSLLISASEADMGVIRELLRVIDVEPTEAFGGIAKVAVIPLTRARASDLADTLQEMLSSNQDVTASMEEQMRRLNVLIHKADGGEPTSLPPVDLEKPIKIMPEPTTNAIIVASVESNLDPIEALVRQLDNVPMSEEMLVRLYPLEHADADNVRDNIQSIFDKGENLARIPERTIESITPGGIASGLGLRIDVVADARTNTVIVAGRAEQQLLVKQMIDAMDIQADGHLYEPRLVKLEHADVGHVGEVIQQLTDRWQELADEIGGLTAKRERVLVIQDIRTNSLIVVARDDQFKEIESLAKRIDQPRDPLLGEIRIISLQNLNAGDLAEKINQLWERRIELGRGTEGEAVDTRPVIVTDTRSNALIVASNQDDFNEITSLIERLEQQKLSPLTEIRQIILEHNQATDVAGMIEEVFNERREQSVVEGQQPDPSQRVGLVADPMTNTLLVVSNQENYDEVLKLISKLDVEPAADALIRTFPVRNADVTDTAEKLERLFDGLVIPGVQELPEYETAVTIIPDVRSSMLIVSASQSNFSLIETILAKIDRVDAPMLPAESRFIHLEHADVVNVADLLDQVFEGLRPALGDQSEQLDVTLIPDVRSNTLIVAGSRLAVRKVEELIPRFDTKVADGASRVEVYSLEQASAPQVADVMTELFDERASANAAGERTPITIIPEAGSNSLIITASREDHETVKELLSKIDRESPLAQRMEIIPLKQARANQIADTLEELVQEQGGEQEVAFSVTPDERINSLIVFASPDLMANIRTIVEKIDRSEPPTKLEMRVFRLRNQNAEDFAQLLRDFFEEAGAGNTDEAKTLILKFTHFDPDTGLDIAETLVHQDITITPDPATNTLMVMAPEAQIEMLGYLIEKLDSVEPVPVEIVSFQLVNADAQEMRDLLEELFNPEGDSGERRRLMFAAEGEPAAPAQGGDNTAIELAFSVDRRTNTLIAAGSRSYLKMVERLVLQLDYEPMEERVVNVVPVHYLPAEDLAATLRDYFEAESGLREQVVQGEEAATQQLQREVTVQDVGDTSNLVILTYSPRMEGRVLSLVNELDQPQPQVMIQVLIAEVTLNDNFELGMEFAVQDLLFSEHAFTGPNGTLQGDNHDFVFGTDVGATGQSGIGGVTFTISGEDFNFLFRALQSESRLEVISRPSIMVQDKQEANITVGERVPTVQDVVVSSSGIVTPSVSYEEVGIILDVTPIINPDGYVNLIIAPEISAIGTSSVTITSGVQLPTFTERKASTTVTVKDGETIVIGGLITSRDRESENKVPILGDLPLLGMFNRANITESNKTELLIVLTPHVIRTIEDARKMSVHMRDSTGMMENIRKSPLMQGLQVRPEDDHFGPIDHLRPQNPPGEPDDEVMEEMGPELDEYGPAADTIQTEPDGGEVVAAATEGK